ncbi:glutathione ABC transporter substrate-binding protein [Oceanobacillus jeddahense]|uniref:Glutathione ABC transporter substrate-binding protein n=1 Tax=Oceanobacillus jeddahense TaxID=1462527 RepID=A0ABY5JTJ2_9BACI|nr:glutathione ABC transporter substrate-binding protein [Oceanobacillus jeddahense]UUI03124.1 glutathione ABC transporter substrate-binding protein [Oceanobacillus jeddahense]
MKLSKKSLLLLVFGLLVSVVLVACASEPDEGGNNDSDGDEEGTSEEATEGGELIISNQSDIVAMDPAGSNDVPSSNVQNNVFETLVTLDENMEIQPLLATEWEQVEDTVWEFTLRDDVTFHDGTEFTAETVKANIERILDPDVASPRFFLYEMVEEVEVVDDHTVRFTTEYPFGPFLAHLAHNGGSMVSEEAIEADYEAMENGEDPGSYINQNPIGTGFFEFDSWDPGSEVRLVKNEDYWGETAHLDSVVFKVVSEGLTRVAELQTGDSHISDPLSPNDVEQLENTDGTHAAPQDSVSLSYIGFNVEKEPFDDPDVRKAINMAIDRDQIVDGIYNGHGIPATGPLAPPVVGYDENAAGLDYDLEEAKQLLADAGYEDGFSTTIWTNDQQERVDIATNVQSQLQELNIDVEVEVLEWGTYLERTAQGDHDMFVLGWSTSTGDADYGLYPLFHSSNLGDPGNRTFLQDDDLDQMLEDARREVDEDARMEILSDIQAELAEIAPMLYVHHQELLLGVRDEVQGLTQLPTGILQLQDVSLEQ